MAATAWVRSRAVQLSKVLVVDDDASVIKSVRRMLRPIEIVATTSGREALDLARREQPQLALVDVYLRDVWGLDVVSQLRGEFPTLVIAVMSGLMTLDLAGESVRRSASWFIEKPFTKKTLRDAVTTSNAPFQLPPDEDADLSMALAQWNHLQVVLSHTNGNRSEAARRLGIARQTVQRMLKRSTETDDEERD